MAGLPSPPLKGISLLFLKADDLMSTNQREFINGLEIIYAIENVTGRGTIEGAQKIGKLYRIYIKSDIARDKLFTEGFAFRDRHVSLYTHNPYTVKDQIDTVKIIIGGVPLSVAHEEFEKALIELNVDIVSDIKFENYRDSNGKWTAYKTGRRFVYCKKPNLNLKPFTKIGLWNASIYYRGQVRPSKPYNSFQNSDFDNTQTDHHDTQPCSDERVCTNTSASNGSDASLSVPVSNTSDPVMQVNSVWDIAGRDTEDSLSSDPPSYTASASVEESMPKHSQSDLLAGKSTVLGNRSADSKVMQETHANSVTSNGKLGEERSRKLTRVGQHRLTDYLKDRRQRSQSKGSNKRKGLVSPRTPSPPPKNPTNPGQTPSASPLPTDWFNCAESSKTDKR